MPRIFQTHVSTAFAATGPLDVVLLGEAPGPRGADQSGVPFWGDRAGLLVYRALEATGRAEVPATAYEDWDGARLKVENCFPVLHYTALGNAFPSCPTNDGDTFRAPTDRELRNPENLDRLRADLDAARKRCEGSLQIITLGKRASFVIEGLLIPGDRLTALPHPSSQGLLQAAPNRGKGLRLADLQVAWEEQLRRLLVRD